jgi:hypothetical protein
MNLLSAASIDCCWNELKWFNFMAVITFKHGCAIAARNTVG